MADVVRQRESVTKKISFHEKQSRNYRTIESMQKVPTKKRITLNQYHFKKKSQSIASHTNLSKYTPDRRMKSLSKYDKSLTKCEKSLPKYEPSRLNDSKKNPINRPEFKELNLATIINPDPVSEDEATLEDVFQAGCLIYQDYLRQKGDKLTQTQGKSTIQMKAIKENLNNMLQDAHEKFRTIQCQVGQMSCKNLLMIGAVLYQQGKYNDAIMYISRAMDKTDGNLFLLKFSGNQSTCFSKNFMSYGYLAEAYKSTGNYLCAINVISKCQSMMKAIFKSGNSLKNLKQHYQTLQPRETEQIPRIDPRQAIKKKSYLLTSLRPEPTTNKFKKHSQANHNNQFSSIQLNKSKKNLEVTQRNNDSVKQADDDYIAPIKFVSQKQSMIVFQPVSEISENNYRQYTNQLTMLFLLQARLYIKIKSYDLAINCYKKCLKINPRKIQSLLQLASLYYLKYSSHKSLEFLENSLKNFEKEQIKDHRWQLDYSYIKYHKSLILLQQGKSDQSYQIFISITVQQLSSEINFYKGVIKLRNLNDNLTLNKTQRNCQLESIMMNFNESIAAFTSKQYLMKSYFYILLILVFQKKDYYGAQYEVNRFKKIMPSKSEVGKQEQKLGISRISRIYEQQDYIERQSNSSGLWSKQNYFQLLFDLIDGVICILKMKVNKGISIFKQVSLKVQNSSESIIKYYGSYYSQIIKLLFQFKFYGYYILREYELSLKHVNKLLEIFQKQSKKYKQCHLQIRNSHNIQIKLITINKLMLECIILMKQSKFNYAMSKLTQIQSLMNQPNQPVTQSHPTNSALILNNFNMMKSLCFINLYSQLQHEKTGQICKTSEQQNEDNNKEILLSAQELLRHCLISDKENSLIYYLISVIHYELQQYQSSLKYIREALELSDDHMIKHYFSKANTKFMLGRYDQAIKDYTNAVIVYKQQTKNDIELKGTMPKKSTKIIPKQELQEQYYAEKQVMFNEIYLNRAISYLKYSYELAAHRNYGEHASAISSYKSKACEDLTKFFTSLNQSKHNYTEKQLRNWLLLFFHTDDPSQMLQMAKSLSNKHIYINEEDNVKIYYLIKELNNCITTLKTYLGHLQHRYEQREIQRIKKDNLPTKHKKISMRLPKKLSEITEEGQKICKIQFDLKCLESLKKSSSKAQGALESALISLLQMTEQIYRKRQQQIAARGGIDEQQNITLQNLFIHNCGQIFKWSDILFFIGVIHFELKEYETAIKYFQQSQNQKRANNTLYSLSKYIKQVLLKSNGAEEESQYLFCELQPLFQNRIYCKQQLQYNIGICYLMMKQYKQAYYFLQNYPNFLMIIKKAINTDKQSFVENQFMTRQENNKSVKKKFIEHTEEQIKSAKKSKSGRKGKSDPKQQHFSGLSSLSESVEGLSQKQSQSDGLENITPFPTHNRLCSIYSPSVVDDKKFYLSFCLPKAQLPQIGLFHPQQTETATLFTTQDNNSSLNSDSSQMKDPEEQKINSYPAEKRSFESVIRHVSLLDLQMKPIAPWIKQNTAGVVFTENLISESIDLNSQRLQRKKEKTQTMKQDKKNKKQRYGANQ